ncbi:hypothetical protein [Stutzerimonas xanthomarina]|uniref:Terminase small subunit n=2 Tax=Stutzerimonas xanthomarina TaxID=271420 RepID=A0A1M5QMS5_9GAMM|nr:hypothetical protein [Stutzerimonas xanthomarina]MCP9338502.1 hypothetical protein [Stutzerimonas xanthomarina]SEH67653.1 hypothetical protein SAMN05216535_1202 [Stutzerimonas xanthomarina]SHH15099.1 hypothetical protein SAMN02744645_2715 [Stutzerimonas xanthomarina DSM 18231]
MALDHDQFNQLLTEAQAHADRAASENNAQHYQQAFESSLKAMRLLAEESGAWRQMVARATEEFEGDEGI